MYSDQYFDANKMIILFLYSHVYEKNMDTLKFDQAVKSISKLQANTQDQGNWKIFCYKHRKDDVANFKLKTGPECMTEHLNGIGILSLNVSQICNVNVMNVEYLLACPGLDQKRGEIGKLY